MYIAPREGSIDQNNKIKKQIQETLDRGPLAEPICNETCLSYDSIIGCNRNCLSAPSQLSSDPASYPVEALIAPLVYEIKKLGVFYPCWSCEGHLDTAGKLWKIPRVWFYADSVTLIRALSESIDGIYSKEKLSTRWKLTITHSDKANPDTTFSLEPNMNGADIKLSVLQSDILKISQHLEVKFKKALQELKSIVN